MEQSNKILKHSAIYAVGNVSRQLVGFLMLPIYTNYLSPSDYGIVGLLIFMVSLIELLFGGHMFHAVPKFYFQEKDSEKRKNILSTALIVTAGISSISIIFCLLLRNQASQLLFGSDEYAVLVSLFSMQILTHALENYALVYIRIQKKPWLFVAVNLAKLGLQLSLNIIFVVTLEMGVMGIALSSLIASSIFAIFMTIYTLRFVGLKVKKSITLRLLKFSWPLWVGGIAGLYIGSSNRYFIRIYSDLSDVGFFELAAKFGTIIVVLVWNPFSQYWQTERFNIYYQQNSVSVFQKVFSMLSTLLIVTALGVSIFSELIIQTMASREFYSSAIAVPFLAFAGVFQSLSIFNNFSFLVKEKTGWIGKNNYITAAIITILYLLLVPSYGYIGAAAAVLLASIAQFSLVFYFAKAHFDMNLKIAPLFTAICISIAAYFLTIVIKNEQLAIDIPLKLLVMAVATVALLFPHRNDIASLVTPSVKKIGDGP